MVSERKIIVAGLADADFVTDSFPRHFSQRDFACFDIDLGDKRTRFFFTLFSFFVGIERFVETLTRVLRCSAAQVDCFSPVTGCFSSFSDKSSGSKEKNHVFFSSKRLRFRSSCLVHFFALYTVYIFLFVRKKNFDMCLNMIFPDRDTTSHDKGCC